MTAKEASSHESALCPNSISVAYQYIGGSTCFFTPFFLPVCSGHPLTLLPSTIHDDLPLFSSAGAYRIGSGSRKDLPLRLTAAFLDRSELGEVVATCGHVVVGWGGE